MTHIFQRFLLFVILFALIGTLGIFVYRYSVVKAQDNFDIQWFYNSIPTEDITASSVFLKGIVNRGSYTDATAYFTVVPNNQGQSKFPMKTSATIELNEDGDFGAIVQPLYPNMEYCATLRYGANAGDIYGYVDTPLCFTTKAGSDADIRDVFAPITFPPLDSNICDTKITARGRLEGLKSSEKALYFFQWRDLSDTFYKFYPDEPQAKEKIGSGWVADELITGLKPNNTYEIRLVGVFENISYRSDLVRFTTKSPGACGAGGGSGGSGIYYCKNGESNCSVIPNTIYSGSDVGLCTVALQQLPGYAGKKCYASTDMTQCVASCSSQPRQYFYCAENGKDCVTSTEAYASPDDCYNNFLKNKFPLANKCYESVDKASCDTQCKSSTNYFFYCASAKTCTVTTKPYATKADCEKVLNTTDYAGRGCYLNSERAACDQKCAGINISAGGGGGGGGGGKSSISKYYFCGEGKSQCIFTEKNSLDDCNKFLKQTYGSNTTKRCYESSKRNDCNTACEKSQGKRYWFCMTDTGKCFQTGSTQKDLTACKSYVLSKYFSRTTGWCYEDQGNCQKNCLLTLKSPVTPPVNTGSGSAPAPQSKMYVCIKDKKKCEVTYQFTGTDVDQCAEIVKKNMPDKTTDECYENIEDCSYDCEAATVAGDANSKDTFSWANFEGKDLLSKLKVQGMCGGSWPFALTNVIETKYNIDNGVSGLGLDLSEQYLISCLDLSSCQRGGFDATIVEKAMEGVLDETCVPYVSAYFMPENGEPSCQRCLAENNSKWKVDDAQYLPPGDNDAFKQAIKINGPVLTSYFAGGKVDGRFVGPDYSKEIATCDKKGNNNHIVEVIGFNDVDKYWIVRNAWGLNWSKFNKAGVVKIGYDQCGLFSEGAYYVGRVINP